MCTFYLIYSFICFQVHTGGLLASPLNLLVASRDPLNESLRPEAVVAFLSTQQLDHHHQPSLFYLPSSAVECDTLVYRSSLDSPERQ